MVQIFFFKFSVFSKTNEIHEYLEKLQTNIEIHNLFKVHMCMQQLTYEVAKYFFCEQL